VPDAGALAVDRLRGGADPPLRATALSYRYPGRSTDALRDVSLELGAGEMVVLAGRSGSGKSTLLRAACGLVPHYFGGEVRGELDVAGLAVRDHGPAELGGAVGFVAQDPEGQVVSATVRGEIELPLEMRGDAAAARARAVEEVALALGVAHLLDRTADSLSGGELQRVALAAALVGRPGLILLDEPTSQLDPVAGDELIGLLRRLNEEWGTAIVVCEHRLERCLAAADRAVAMVDGTIAFDGEPAELLAWAIDADPALVTPGARLFERAGLGPPPTSVKSARAALRRLGIDVGGAGGAGPAGARLGPGHGPHDAEAAPARASDGPRRGRRSRKAEAALEARALWVDHPDGVGRRTALRGIDLRVERGDLVALMGRNGAGKSSLLRAAAGVLEPARGRIGAPGGCALLSQSPGDYLVRERVGDELPGAAGRAALAAVDMSWAEDRDPRDLSGGERQRLALAIAMAGRGIGGDPPALVCLDEPTRGMDRARKEGLRELIAALAGAGAATIVATHDVEFAASFASRVVLLGDGEVIADGPGREILSGGWYFSTEVARILGRPGAITPEQGADSLRDALLDASGPSANPPPPDAGAGSNARGVAAGQVNPLRRLSAPYMRLRRRNAAAWNTWRERRRRRRDS
jgi:energy-coupling factor transporter ATP-binding protein EcfA2